VKWQGSSRTNSRGGQLVRHATEMPLLGGPWADHRGCSSKRGAVNSFLEIPEWP
jgi:hypothetical protein